MTDRAVDTVQDIIDNTDYVAEPETKGADHLIKELEPTSANEGMQHSATTDEYDELDAMIISHKDDVQAAAMDILEFMSDKYEDAYTILDNLSSSALDVFVKAFGTTDSEELWDEHIRPMVESKNEDAKGNIGEIIVDYNYVESGQGYLDIRKGEEKAYKIFGNVNGVQFDDEVEDFAAAKELIEQKLAKQEINLFDTEFNTFEAKQVTKATEEFDGGDITFDGASDFVESEEVVTAVEEPANVKPATGIYPDTFRVHAKYPGLGWQEIYSGSEEDIANQRYDRVEQNIKDGKSDAIEVSYASPGEPDVLLVQAGKVDIPAELA